MVLVSILGDFHSSILPIFFEFKDKIKKHIIIYDDNRYEEKQLNKILKGQEVFLENNENIDFEIKTIKIDEDNYDSILDAYDLIVKSDSNMQNIYLNTTDGLSSISIVLSSNLLQNAGNVLSYDKYANTYNIHTLNSIVKSTMQNNLDIKTHLKLIGYDIKIFTNRFELENRKSTILELTKDLAKYKFFVNLLQKTKAEDIDGFEKFKTLLSNIDKLDDRIFMQGTVFEEYIYHLLRDNLELDDIMTGVKIEFNTNFTNELDILMMKDNHLHTIECKFVNSLNGEHYVYKTNSIMDYLDNDGKAMILSIGADNVNKNNKAQFTKGARSRAENGNIKIHQSKIFNEDNFLSDVREWFNISNKQVD